VLQGGGVAQAVAESVRGVVVNYRGHFGYFLRNCPLPSHRCGRMDGMECHKCRPRWELVSTAVPPPMCLARVKYISVCIVVGVALWIIRKVVATFVYWYCL
jgi:hypothetical protein